MTKTTAGVVELNAYHAEQVAEIARCIDPGIWTYTLSPAVMGLKPKGVSDTEYLESKWRNNADRRLLTLTRARAVIEALLAFEHEKKMARIVDKHGKSVDMSDCS